MIRGKSPRWAIWLSRSVRSLWFWTTPAGTPARDVVASIGPRLLKDAIAVEIDGAVLSADATNLFGGPALIRQKLAILRGHCDDAGRDYGDIVKTRLGTVVIGESDREVDAKVQRYRMGEAVESGMAMAGTPDQLIAQFEELWAAGVEYFMVNMRDSYLPEPVKLFAREVIPAFGGR